MQEKRLFPIYLALLLIFFFLGINLFSKTLISYKYYRSLSEANKTKQKKIIAPRGVFLDREGVPLVINKHQQKYGYLRWYLYPRSTAHLLGYLSLPDAVNLQDYSCGAPPLSNQFIGKTALEKYFECSLRGKPGEVIYEVDASGKIIRELARKNPKEGQNIQLTISLKLQQVAEKAFRGLKGGVIASNPNTGEVFLFYSSPSFDNNEIMSQGNLYERLAQNESKPLFNRLTLGLYPPGSVIKPVIALGALQSNIIDKNTQYTDNGIFKLGGVEFGNWYFLEYGKTEGEVDVVKGIKRSNDIFFYHLGVEMGISKINHWLENFGLKKQFLEKYFPQAIGLLPNDSWKRKTLGEPWYLGDTVNLSIGQGYLLVNPVQLHTAIAIIAGNGYQCDLHFTNDDLGHCYNLEIDQEHINTVTQGMIEACQPGGTGWPFFDYKITQEKMTVACKTGTAESTANGALPHAWFTVFAPAHSPEIALTVLVENGGEGSDVAAPIAKQILDSYFASE